MASALLRDIASQQVKTNGEFFAGAFPSFRKCRGIPHNYQPDNNIFFTAISIFTLKQLLPELSDGDRKTAQQIIDSAQKAFQYYQDKGGNPYYSFWPAGQGILPHSYFIRKFKAIDMGEDADDAVMSLMAINEEREKKIALKDRMIEVSNGRVGQTNSTYRRYRKYNAYSTWLGKKMKPDFDLGVQCNVIYFMLENNIPLLKNDNETINLIAEMMHNREYIRHPVFVSPFYARTPVLLYHLARLMGKFRISRLESYKPQLVKDIHQQLDKSASLMDRIILSTSLLRLGEKPSDIQIPSSAEFEIRTRAFKFFQARAAFSYPVFCKMIFLHHPYLIYDFYCPVYNKVLLLEYLVERNNKKN